MTLSRSAVDLVEAEFRAFKRRAPDLVRTWESHDDQFCDAQRIRNLVTDETERQRHKARREREAWYADDGATRKRNFIELPPPDPDMDRLREWSRRRANVASGIAARAAASVIDAYRELAAYVGRFGIAAPLPRPEWDVASLELIANGHDTLAGLVRRMTSAKWWKRKGRETTIERAERRAIKLGRVHRLAEAVASDNACAWRRAGRDSNDELALELDLVNEVGERCNLSTAIEASVANPELRRHELMVRIRGIETMAKAHGLVALFVTWTLPSRFHPRLWETGAKNPRWDGTSCAHEGQAELTAQWARARAWLSTEHRIRSGPDYFGLRVVEPHHDGTPHWHLLMFIRPDAVDLVKRAIGMQAFAEAPTEPGAKTARLKFVTIDERKGTAAGYVAKYVSKNVDGQKIGSYATVDDQGNQVLAALEGETYAERVTAWARAWRIRQFQFFGDNAHATVTQYRELRRVREPLQLSLFEPARVAADAGDWAAFVAAGIEAELVRVPRYLGPFSPLTASGEAAALPTWGIGSEREDGELVCTRPHVWTLESSRGPPHAGTESAAPWTRVNNCKSAGPPTDFPDRFSDHPPDRPPDRAPDLVTK